MIYFRQNHDESREGLHRAAQQTVGQLGLYRESAVRMIVRIVGANVIKPRANNAMLEVEVEVLAAYCAREMPLPASGKRFTASCPVSGGHISGRLSC